MDIQKQIEIFNTLPYGTQKEKVLAMLKELKDTHEIFDNFYKVVDAIKDVDKEVLLYIYKNILEIAEEIQQGNKKLANEHMDSMYEHIQKIRTEEETYNKREGNPEDVLQQI